ncbi:MAG: tetratricopeptide repeat protein, partial [Myxococcales bacterium]|nr:tetratricopeptide repeat protein [Myxococcales bacterium]
MRSEPAHQGYVFDCQTQAAQWVAAGRPDQAAYLYAAALEQQPDDIRTRMMLADCLVRTGRSADAAEHYLQVALGYASLRRDGEAMAICHQVLHLDPQRFVYVDVASMLRRIGRQAHPLCTRAAQAHLAAGRFADGLELLRLGVELDPRNPEAHQQLAQLMLQLHMVADAVAHLADAGRLLLAAGNNAKYVEVAEQLLYFDPSHLETLRELPRVYLRIGEPQRAVVKLSDLMRVSPGDTAGFEILAHAFAIIGRTTTALSILQRLVAELTATGRRPLAEAIVARAQRWRQGDGAFQAEVHKLRDLRSAPRPAPKRAEERPTTPEGTVVLDLADLMETQATPPAAPELVDLSSELVEIGEAESTMVLRLRDFSPVEPAPPRRPPPVPAARATTPAETTQVVELSEIELDEDTAV